MSNAPSIYSGETLAAQDRDPMGQNLPGGNAAGGGDAPGDEGETYAMTKKWVQVDWKYTEQEPEGACTGFEVAIFHGGSIDSGILAEPLAAVDHPGARQYRCLLELRTKIELSAAVRACYGEFRSEWTQASAAALFIPGIQVNSEDGCIKFPDGTIMQWMTSKAITAQESLTVKWPQPFPETCFSASVTPVMDTIDDGNDNWFQLVSKNTRNVTVYKQGARDGHYMALPLRAHIVGWGR